jgi:hypothetical protein
VDWMCRKVEQGTVGVMAWTRIEKQKTA